MPLDVAGGAALGFVIDAAMTLVSRGRDHRPYRTRQCRDFMKAGGRDPQRMLSYEPNGRHRPARIPRNQDPREAG